MLEAVFGVIALAAGFMERRWDVEQLAGAGEVFGTAAIGKEPVVSDAVKAVGQDVEEEASDEFGYRQGHGLVQITAFGPVVLILEGDLLVVEGDEAAV